MMPFVDLNWLKSKSRKSKYMVLDDKPEDRFHIHCYVPEEIYQKFKTVHKDLDFYIQLNLITKPFIPKIIYNRNIRIAGTIAKRNRKMKKNNI